ncbi:MAG: alpha/beta hydrolase fold domain-containing protein [Actinomycetota bacterium]
MRVRIAFAIFVAACGGSNPTTVVESAEAAAPTVTPVQATATSTVPLPTHLLTTDTLGGLPIEVYGRDEPGNDPVVVMFHGGGWFGGSPASTAGLAEYLASTGAVVFNASYRTADGGFPESFDDVACAIRFARERAKNFTVQSEVLTVIGHSAGAHLAAVVALAGDTFHDECPIDGSAKVDRFVGLAGPYDPVLYSLILANYFGTRLEDDPTPWVAGSPYTYLGENPDMEALIVHGEADEFVPVASSELFASALDEAGYRVGLQIVEGASHQDVRRPEVIGELLFDWLGG